jgi:hypothetical protein
MHYDGLQLDACLRLLGAEIQRTGKIIIWFSSNLESGTKRWAAIYEYEGGYHAQSTDAGQTGRCAELSGAFGVAISDIDIASLKIGGVSMPQKSFIQLLRRELQDAAYGIFGLDSQRIDAVATKMSDDDDTENKADGDAGYAEFVRRRESANTAGSPIKLWPGEDPEQWEDDFLQLLNKNGRMVYSLFWNSGAPGAGADIEYIEEFLGHYWVRTSTDGLSGPYESFAEVFGDEFRYVTSATESIWCTEMSTEELLSKLILDKDSLDPDFTIEINDKPYVLTEEFELVPAQ